MHESLPFDLPGSRADTDYVLKEENIGGCKNLGYNLGVNKEKIFCFEAIQITFLWPMGHIIKSLGKQIEREYQ